MCRDCGCEEAGAAHDHWINGKKITHTHGHEAQYQPVKRPRKLSLEQSILAKNDRFASSNRQWFTTYGITVFNLISSPGSGKTLLLEKTIEKLSGVLKITILTGDQEHSFDAERLKTAGAEVRQLNTGSSCHLDASMIQNELGHFVKPEPQLLIIENVGNLVCPAAFDLGETLKVAFLSCTEGEDKPSKYPLLFHEASLIVLTKMDLEPHLDWSLKLCEEHIRRVNATAPILRLSSKNGVGLDSWLDFLRIGIQEQTA
jgi:hydrogenase nickel incorporation protein HypB